MALGANGLSPNILLAAMLAAVSGSAFYGLGPILLLRNTGVYHLFCGHGWVPYVCVFLFCCGFWGLMLKLPLQRQQRSALSLGLLPEAVDARIEPADAKKILDRISRLSRQQRSLWLVRRVRQALLRLNQLGTAEKLDDLLRYRAETDEMAMESSYAAPKFIVWAIPVLGFVGTVLGISNGVGAFSTLIQNASDLEGLRESLKGVTYGLGQAFETTMVALCMSLCLMLLLAWMQRRDEHLLATMDDYCMEHLLHKVAAPVAGSIATAELTAAVLALRDSFERYRGNGAVPAIASPTTVKDDGLTSS